MTQVPHSQRPVDGLVVPGDASTLGSPATARTAPATHPRGLPDDLHNALVLAVHKVGIPVFAASAVAEAIGAHTRLLDALIAYRQQVRPAGYVVARIQELNDDTEGPQLNGFSEDVLPTERAARNRHSDAEHWRPGWRIYALTDITERPTDA